MLHLNGSVQFDSSSNRQPPVVELYQALPESNVSARIFGELTNIDEENPVVTIYYGLSDGGLSVDGWDSNLTLNGGSPLPAGTFEANISNLVPGERYFFRAFAESADGSDWSTGEPEIKEDLMAFWRLDEDSGHQAIDSVIPIRNAEIVGQDVNVSRVSGYSGNALKLDGGDDWINLDPNNAGYLGDSLKDALSWHG